MLTPVQLRNAAKQSQDARAWLQQNGRTVEACDWETLDDGRAADLYVRWQDGLIRLRRLQATLWQRMKQARVGELPWQGRAELAQLLQVESAQVSYIEGLEQMFLTRYASLPQAITVTETD